MDISTREFLAGLAMAGMLSSQKTDTLETITNDAVIAADLLLKALGDSDHSLTPESLTGHVKGFGENIFSPSFLNDAASGVSDYLQSTRK